MRRPKRSGCGGSGPLWLEYLAAFDVRGRQLHTHRRGLGASQGERRAADTHCQRVATQPHASDDFAARTGHEPQVTQSRDQ